MIVDVTEGLTIVSTRGFGSIEYIDGGDTVVLKLIAVDGREVAVLIPLQVTKEMLQAFEPCKLAKLSEGDPKGR